MPATEEPTRAFLQQLRDATQPGSSLADFELEPVRDAMIAELTKASSFLRDTAVGVPQEMTNKKWWQFWR